MQGFRSCNLCRHDSAALMFVKDGYRIVRCDHCSLVYVGDELAGIDFAALYGEAYYQGGSNQVFADYLGQAAERRALARRKLWRLRRLARSGRLLDVGCAAGFFLAEASRHYDCEGVELSAFASAFAREQLGLTVRTGTLAEARFESASFDLVTLWDVIEHVADPREQLEEVARLLKPGGHAVLTTGDIESGYARARGADWPLMGPPWHLYYFSRATLARMAAAAGLRSVGCTALGTVSDHPLLRNRPARVLAHLTGQGDIMQMTLAKA